MKTIILQASPDSDASAFLVILFLLLGLLLYFLPSIVGKDKRNAGAIFVLNLFLGWTFVGWIVSLVWALTNDAPTAQNVYVADRHENKVDKVDKFDKLAKIKTLLDSGAITADEYEREKSKILSE